MNGNPTKTPPLPRLWSAIGRLSIDLNVIRPLDQQRGASFEIILRTGQVRQERALGHLLGAPRLSPEEDHSPRRRDDRHSDDLDFVVLDGSN